MWNAWEPEILEKLIERHQNVKAHVKAKKRNRGFTMLVAADDWADYGDKVMHTLLNDLHEDFKYIIKGTIS